MEKKEHEIRSGEWQGVLDFWFEELKKPQDWFVSTPALDNTIKTRFAHLLQYLSTQHTLIPVSSDSLTQASLSSGSTLLAAILVTDQFSRNIHRGSAQAFATDPIALALSEYLLNHQMLEPMNTEQRQFALMPLMHSERIEIQNKSVAMFKEYGVTEAVDHAVEHCEIVRQFGRFPHRNALLGRVSTQAEEAYLKDAKTFGQA